MRLMKEYLDLLRRVRDEGSCRSDRTGTGAISLFGPQLEIDISERFPLLTTKRVFFKGVVAELLWFISGNTNVGYLKENGVSIWDEWADGNGDLGRVYGAQWREFRGYDGRSVDQLSEVIERIKTSPYDRRLIVSAWNPAELDEMALPPCHLLYQFYVSGDWLSCKMYQRSADMFLGVPFNVASYALLTALVARLVGLKPERLIISFGDAHIYLNHLDQVERQLSREPRELPKLSILDRGQRSIDDFRLEDVKLEGYDPLPAIQAPIAI